MKAISNSYIVLLIISMFSANDNSQDIATILHSIYNRSEIDTSLILLDRNIVIQATNLEYIGKDIYGRKQYLSTDAANAWKNMKKAATSSGINLFFVSGFRSYSYQASIFKRKIGKGILIEDILKYNKLPGYSEHHSGRAIDITSSESTGLSDDFVNTDEYRWLLENCDRFGFRLTYKEGNNTDIMFEPWHWYYYR